MDVQKKKVYVLLSVLFIYVFLVSTHRGEFWPFSIFPMYSQAGNPWSKILVRDVTNIQDSTQWREVSQLNQLPGPPVALNNINVNQNDLSSFIVKTEEWDAEQISALRTFFTKLFNYKLLIYKVSGSIINDTVKIQYKPLIFLSSDTTFILLPSPN